MTNEEFQKLVIEKLDNLEKGQRSLEVDVKELKKDVKEVKRDIKAIWSDILTLDNRLSVQEETVNKIAK